MPPTIQIHGRPVRFESAVAPEREADRLLEGLPFSSTSLVLLFGCSTRILLERIRSRVRPSTLLLCVDPDNQLLNLLPEELRSEALFFDFGDPGKISAVIEDHFYRKRKGVFRHLLIRNPNITRHFTAEYDALERTLTPLFHDLYRNSLVLKKFGRLWLRNIRANCVSARERGYSLAEWKNRWSGQPALILCAGPSLDRILPKLTELRDRFVFLCVDTALVPLLKHGIVPDIVVSLDGQIDNIADFTDPLVRARCGKTDLVMEVTAHRRIPSLFPGGFFPFSTVKLLEDPEAGKKQEFIEPHYRLFTSAFRTTEGLQTGGSVSTTALDLAILCGFSKMIFAGQDLGFLDYRLYCRGTYADRSLSLRENRFLPRSNRLFRYMTASDRPLVITPLGECFRSSTVMDGYRRWLANASNLLKGRVRFCEAPWLDPSDDSFLTIEELSRFPVIAKRPGPRTALPPADAAGTPPSEDEITDYLGITKIPT